MSGYRIEGIQNGPPVLLECTSTMDDAGLCISKDGTKWLEQGFISLLITTDDDEE